MHQTQENYNITRYIDKPLPHELLEDEVFRLKGSTLCPGLGARWVAQYEPALLRKEVIDRAWCGGKNQWVREHYRPLLERYGLIKSPTPRKQASAIQTDIADIDARMAEADAIIADIDARMAEVDAIESSASTVESTPAVIESTPAPENNQDKKAESSLISVESLTPDIAPAFRGYGPQPLIANAADRCELVRRRVADIAYIHAKGHRANVDTSLCDGKFKDMLAGDKLDIDLVREFAEHVSSPEGRKTDEHIAVNILFIPACMQIRLCQLVSEAIKRKRARTINEAPTVRAKLERSVRQSGDGRNMKHVEQWVQLWVADQLVSFAMKKRSPQEVGFLLGAMTGTKVMPRSDVAKKLKCIDARL